MGDWLRHIALRAKARTGFGPQLVVCGLIAVVSLTLGLGFLCIALYVWLARRTDPVTAGLLLAGVFLLIAIIAAVAGGIARRRNIERARLELAARSGAGWLDPKFLSVGIEIGRTLGWRRLMMLAAAGLLAAGLGKEWSGASEQKDPKPE
jgi:hypothetical protein